MTTDQSGLDGAPNFRELGGYPTAGGLCVRRGRVFRSESLARLSDAGVAALASHGIGLVYDLRGSAERSHEINRWPEGAAPEVLAGLDAAGLEAVSFQGWRQRLLEPDFDGAAGRAWMRESYALMPRLFAPFLESLFARLALADAPPVLIHCAAGKDRTGFVCAMLLLALGVEPIQVVADYLLTRQRHDPQQLLLHLLGDDLYSYGPQPRAALDAMIDVDAAYLGTALRAVEHDYGSLASYLERACGLDSSRGAALRAALLESAAS